jgi:hypothetical protein
MHLFFSIQINCAKIISFLKFPKTLFEDVMALLEIKNREELEKLIEKAIKKLHVSRENELCKYLPGDTGGYMHHFTLRKLKHAAPERLISLIQNFILEMETPHALMPKRRAPRGSRKQNEMLHFSRADIEKVLDLARKAGDKDLLARFCPKRPLALLKKELIRSIRENRICHELWNSYVELVEGQKDS